MGHMRQSGKGSEVLHCLFSGYVLVWPELPQIPHLLMCLVGGGLVSSSSDSLPPHIAITISYGVILERDGCQWTYQVLCRGSTEFPDLSIEVPLLFIGETGWQDLRG